MKKKIASIVIVALLTMFFIPYKDLHAEDFAGNEEYWLNRCSVPQETNASAQQCALFKEYYAEKSDQLSNQVGEIDKKIAAISKNVDEISGAVKKIQGIIENLNKNIKINEENIRHIDGQITKLNTEIKQKEEDIKKRNKIITDRMLAEQGTLGTNIDVEIIMGSNDLVDMIRKVDGLQRITDSDQVEIEKIVKDKEKLDLQKSEKSRLKADVEDKKAANEKRKKENEKAEKEKKELLNNYLKQEAELNEKARSVKVDRASIQNNIISINTSVAGDLNFNGNGSLRMPVQGGTPSAGVWYYPGGGVHLGLDIAAPIGTRIVAPADGIILYANNPAGTNSGFIGNLYGPSAGYPAGGGNTIHMLTQVDGTTYGLSFFHMSQEGFAVSAGQQVKAGQALGLTGNSGNTTGPHCHMEVINLGKMSIANAISTFQSNADFAWGTGWGNDALNYTCDVKGPPCRENPAKVYG